MSRYIVRPAAERDLDAHADYYAERSLAQKSNSEQNPKSLIVLRPAGRHPL